jgi:thioredoxin 1
MSETIEFTDSNFEEEVLKSDKPCLVDFWAEWCGPCRMVGPIVEEIAKEYAEKLKVGKLNVDQNGQTAAKYGIMSIPSLLIFDQGKVVDQIVGAAPKKQFVERIDKIVK